MSAYVANFVIAFNSFFKKEVIIVVKLEMYVKCLAELAKYRRGTDVLAILLKSDPSFYVIGRFCNNKK